MLKPDLVMRVIPPTVTITATAPAVPNSQAATALLDPFFAVKDCLPAAAAAAAASCCTVAAAEEDGWGGGGGRASLSPERVEQCRLVRVLLAAAPMPIFLWQFAEPVKPLEETRRMAETVLARRAKSMGVMLV